MVAVENIVNNTGVTKYCSGCSGPLASQYPHPSDADFMCKIRRSGCGYRFVARSKLPAIMATVIQLIYLKLSSCKRTSSEQLK